MDKPTVVIEVDRGTYTAVYVSGDVRVIMYDNDSGEQWTVEPDPYEYFLDLTEDED